MKMRLTFKRLMSIVVIIGLIVGGYFLFFKKTSSTLTETVSATVKRGTIATSTNVTGVAKLVYEQKIRFNQAGKVTGIYVKAGTGVKKDQLIAQLDNTDAMNQVKQAELSLANSQVKLAQDLKPLEQKDILSSQSNLDKTQSDLDLANINLDILKQTQENALKDLDIRIASKKQDILTKMSQLKLGQQQLDLLTKQEGKNVSDSSVTNDETLNSAFTDARKYLLDAQKYLISIDEIFGISSDNQTKNDAFEMYLSAKDGHFKSETQNTWQKARGMLDVNNALLATIDPNNLDGVALAKLLESIQSLYDTLITVAKNASDATNASIASASYSQSEIDSQYASMLSILSSTQSSFSAIKTILANLQTINDPAIQKLQSDTNLAKQQSSVNDQKIALDTAKNDLISLQNSRALTIANDLQQVKQQEASIQNLENSLATSQASFEYLKKGATPEQIALDKNNITQQGLNLQNAKKSLDKYQIKAPFDGIVNQIDFQVGDNLIADDTKYVYISNPNQLQITAQLDQTEVVKLTVGQPVSIAFDAFTNIIFTGTVSNINSSPIQTSGVTSYEITMLMDKGKYAIYSGMTAKVVIVTKEKKDILTIPLSFVQRKGKTTTVIMKDGSTRTIEVGFANNIMTEVVSGLTENEIITRTVTLSATAASAQSASGNNGNQQRSGGGFGGGGGGGGVRIPGM